MCTLSWSAGPGGYDLFFNRDELRTRNLAVVATHGGEASRGLSGGDGLSQDGFGAEIVVRRRGHHGRGEIELFNPRWSEQPDFVLDMVRGYVEAIVAGVPSPIVRQDALAGERLLEKLAQGTSELSVGIAGEYLATHPPFLERVANLRAARRG